MNPLPSTPVERVRRSGTTLAAFVYGLPLAAGILAAVHYATPPDFILKRYLGHPVERIEVVLFSCAIGTLFAKLLQARVERAACRHGLLSRWDGKPVLVDEAGRLLASLDLSPKRLHNTFLFQRLAAVLEFLVQRRSTDELDDHLRTLTDNDGLTVEGSYALTRFITWAIPILGFLGTVLGITGAIAGVTPEALEKSLSSVTDGLALAFDATALALSLTMTTMFLSFLVERSESGVLESVDRIVDKQLAHRFLRTLGDSGPVVSAVERHTQTVLGATEAIVRQQAEIWSQSVAEIERKAAAAQTTQTDRLATALDAALERTLKAHAQRLAGMEQQFLAQSLKIFEQMGQVSVAVRTAGQEQLVALERLAKTFASQAQSLAQLQQGEKHLVQLQTVLQQNLAALAGSGAFERAVHTLNAAIHLLTARVGDTTAPAALVLPTAATTEVRPHTGKAA
jgi:biopolymer transport protein ExbB/TolQ